MEVTSRAQHPEHLGHGSLSVDHVLKGLDGDDGIEGGPGIAQRLGALDAQVEAVGVGSVGYAVPELLEAGGLDLDPAMRSKPSARRSV